MGPNPATLISHCSWLTNKASTLHSPALTSDASHAAVAHLLWPGTRSASATTQRAVPRPEPPPRGCRPRPAVKRSERTPTRFPSHSSAAAEEGNRGEGGSRGTGLLLASRPPPRPAPAAAPQTTHTRVSGRPAPSGCDGQWASGAVSRGGGRRGREGLGDR